MRVFDVSFLEGFLLTQMFPVFRVQNRTEKLGNIR